MNLSEGCPYCAHLVIDDASVNAGHCAVHPEWRIENAGACFVRIKSNTAVIIEGCPSFLRDSAEAR